MWRLAFFLVSLPAEAAVLRKTIDTKSNGTTKANATKSNATRYSGLDCDMYNRDCYILMHYSNGFCGGSFGACQELDVGSCNGIGDTYVSAQPGSSPGSVVVRPGIDSDCTCHNGDVLQDEFQVDFLDHHGDLQVGQGSCVTSHGIGNRVVKGRWCDNIHADMMSGDACPLASIEFTKMMKQCPSFDADVAGAHSCQKTFR